MASKLAVGGDNITGFVQRFRELQVQRDNTDDLIKDVLVYCQSFQTAMQEENDRLQTELRNCKLDLDSATSSRRDLQQRLHNVEQQAEWMYKENDLLKKRNPYILLLIDGDGLIFQDQWVRQGVEGGKKAAYALRTAVLSKCGELADDIEVIAKVVANVGGLQKAMSRNGILDNMNELRDFTLGFNQAKASFDFVDVGYGKERADSKIRETTRWHLKNYNCKHIILGVCHDAGYAPFLDEVVRDNNTRQRITVLEGVPIVPELLATGVNTMKLSEDLFRHDKIIERSTQAPLQAPSQTSPVQSAPRTASPAVSANSSHAPSISSYATITSTSSPPPQITVPMTFAPKLSPRQKQSTCQTIPPEQPDWSPGPRGLDDPITVNIAVFEGIKKRKDSNKLCNNHFLRGPCTKGEDCPFIHRYKPTTEELNAIRVLARQNPCTVGQDCDNIDCIYGHHCPSIKDNVCTHPYCRFEEDQHPPGTKYTSRLGYSRR